MDKIISILKSVKDTVDYNVEETLIDGEIIDSIELMEIISELEDAYGISVEMEEIIPSNFNSAKAIYNMVMRLREEQ